MTLDKKKIRRISADLSFQNNRMTPSVTAVVMAPAASSPSKMAGRAFRRRMSSSDATSAPVQAPVPGRGMATRTNRIFTAA